MEFGNLTATKVFAQVCLMRCDVYSPSKLVAQRAEVRGRSNMSVLGGAVRDRGKRGSVAAIADDGSVLRGSRRTLLTIAVVVSLAIRVAHLVSVYPTAAFAFHRTWANSDMAIFDGWAQRIVAGDILSRQPFNPWLDFLLKYTTTGQWKEWVGESPVFFKAPLYAYLIAVLRWLFGDPMLPIALVQILAAAASTVLIFLITERLFDTPSGALGALLFALYAPAIHYDVVMLRGPWIAFTALLVTWQLIRLQANPMPAAGWHVGLGVGLGLLFNEGFLSVPLLVLALIAWWTRSPRRCVAVGGGFVAGLIVALLPAIIRSLIVGAPPMQLATTGATAWALCNASDSQPIFFIRPQPSFVSLMEASRGRLADVVWPCLQTFHHGLPEILSFYLHRAAGLIVPFEGSDNASFYYAALKDPLLRWLPNYAVLFPLSAVGLVCAGRSFKRFEPLLPMSLALLASIMLILPLSRYRVTLIVFLFPFAGRALSQVGRWTSRRRFGAAAAAVGTCCLSLHTLEDLNAGDARALLTVGDAYWQILRDPGRALVVYRRALALQPDGAVGDTARARLRSLEAARR